MFSVEPMPRAIIVVMKRRRHSKRAEAALLELRREKRKLLETVADQKRDVTCLRKENSALEARAEAAEEALFALRHACTGMAGMMVGTLRVA
jgi:predicted RNase H-like nuclease (RuvC/YqgF family)